ncbi:MAG: hypothetical protein AABX72_00730 [Nanoarchaeota archaeon]
MTAHQPLDSLLNYFSEQQHHTPLQRITGLVVSGGTTLLARTFDFSLCDDILTFAGGAVFFYTLFRTSGELYRQRSTRAYS